VNDNFDNIFGVMFIASEIQLAKPPLLPNSKALPFPLWLQEGSLLIQSLLAEWDQVRNNLFDRLPYTYPS